MSVKPEEAHMSGYNPERLFERGVLTPLTVLVKKPFSAAEMLEAIAGAVAARATGFSDVDS
jgi:ABC-type uncharacterized transport system permease subunit